MSPERRRPSPPNFEQSVMQLRDEISPKLKRRATRRIRIVGDDLRNIELYSNGGTSLFIDGKLVGFSVDGRRVIRSRKPSVLGLQYGLLRASEFLDENTGRLERELVTRMEEARDKLVGKRK